MKIQIFSSKLFFTNRESIQYIMIGFQDGLQKSITIFFKVGLDSHSQQTFQFLYNNPNSKHIIVDNIAWLKRRQYILFVLFILCRCSYILLWLDGEASRGKSMKYRWGYTKKYLITRQNTTQTDIVCRPINWNMDSNAIQ